MDHSCLEMAHTSCRYLSGANRYLSETSSEGDCCDEHEDPNEEYEEEYADPEEKDEEEDREQEARKQEAREALMVSPTEEERYLCSVKRFSLPMVEKLVASMTVQAVLDPPSVAGSVERVKKWREEPLFSECVSFDRHGNAIIFGITYYSESSLKICLRKWVSKILQQLSPNTDGWESLGDSDLEVEAQIKKKVFAMKREKNRRAFFRKVKKAEEKKKSESVRHLLEEEEAIAVEEKTNSSNQNQLKIFEPIKACEFPDEEWD